MEISNTYSEDAVFLKQHTDAIELKEGRGRIIVVPQYQGRVMTSTSGDGSSSGYGWLNHKVIEKGLLDPAARKGRLEEHIYIFGGEERFWLGPEGGQFAIYFEPGKSFDFENWFTPPAIDVDAFKLESRSENTAVFSHTALLQNYSGTRFNIGIKRTVRVLPQSEVEKLIGLELSSDSSCVAYETKNELTNLGENAWTREKGLLSIWMLGMYAPSPKITVVIPFKSGPESEFGKKVNDNYFGKVPPENLRVEDDVLFFKGDGSLRSKIGISPKRSLGIAGSYDPDSRVINLVLYNQPAGQERYVNSAWEIQDYPYCGDVVNAYNDGSPAPGEPPLGPFYELETSSPAAALKPGETLQHIQQTLHITGSKGDLDSIATAKLGTNLNKINEAFV